MVPDGWKIKTLRSIGNCVSGLTYSPSDVVDENHGVLVLRSSNIQGGKLSFADNVYVDVDIDQDKRVQLNDILVCVRNGSKALIGKSALIKDDRAIGQTHGAFMTVFRSEENSYVFQLFQSEMFHKHVYTDLGATINSINNNNLLNYKFPIPPILELKKIAAILSIWDNAIAANEDLLANSRLRKKALMQQLLTGKKRLPGFAGDSRTLALSEISDVIVSNVDKKSFEDEVSVRLCNYTDVYYNNTITSNMNFMQATASGAEIKKFSLKIGDVIITKDSETPGDIAVPALVSEDLGGVVCGYHLAIIRPDQKKVDSRFLNFLLSVPKTRYYFFTLATGATRFGLSIGSIQKAQFNLPPLLEQREISDILTVADEEIEALEQRISNLKLQKKALMQQLLTGKKRVKVEPVTA